MNGGATAFSKVLGRIDPWLDFLLPAGCLACGTWVPGGRLGGSLLCQRCRSRLPVAPWPRCPRCHHPRGTGRAEATECRECSAWPEELTRARYAFLLAPPADTLVHGLKYEGWAEAAPEMARRMARVAPSAGPSRKRLVVPVPTTQDRLRKRGYNQAALLARGVAEILHLEAIEALVRTRGGPTQVALPPSQRRANVKGVFAPRDGAESAVRGTHVFLVDDVLTTGSTAGAAASALAHMGASEITLLAFARASSSRGAAGR